MLYSKSEQTQFAVQQISSWRCQQLLCCIENQLLTCCATNQYSTRNWFGLQQTWRCQQLIRCAENQLLACCKANQANQPLVLREPGSGKTTSEHFGSVQMLRWCTANQCSGVWPTASCTTFITSSVVANDGSTFVKWRDVMYDDNSRKVLPK